MRANLIHRHMIASLLLLLLGQPAATAQQQNTIPTQEYFVGIEQLYRGRYRDAERILKRELNGAIKTVSSRWIDSICYHAMLGEVYYHQGRLGAALDQFNLACEMFLQNPKWLLGVQFTASPRALNNPRPLPWGRRTRAFPMSQLPASMLMSLGRLDNRQAARQGGVVQPAQNWSINPVEIIRATSLALRRRNELLGPLGTLDINSRALVNTLRRGGAPPNHWSNGWIELLLGIAQIGTGEKREAVSHLERATLLAGKYDHRLTCVALLELGRLQMLDANASAAAATFAEASYLAFYYDDIGVIDDVVRLGSSNRLANLSLPATPQPGPLADWARQKRWDHLWVRTKIGMAEEWMAAGNWNAAASNLKAGQSRLRDARNGLLGNRAQFLEARIQTHRRRDSAGPLLKQVVDDHSSISLRNLRIAMINLQYDAGQLSARKAVNIYQALLADPTAADWSFNPLESLTTLMSNHQDAYDRWFAALMARKDVNMAMAVADQIKRRRYQQALPWGGRLAALRDVISHGGKPATAQSKAQQNDLLLRFPEYARLQKQGHDQISQLRGKWWPNQEDGSNRTVARAWKGWGETVATQEGMLRDIGLEHIVADSTFPPRPTIKQVQQQLQPGQALLVFHNTPTGMIGFFQTVKSQKIWRLASNAKLTNTLTAFLRALGNHDGNRPMPPEELHSTEYQEIGKQLRDALFQDAAIDFQSIDELIVVPDHLIWYVPMEALPITDQGHTLPWISKFRIRYAPTLGLAFLHSGKERQHDQRTGLKFGNLIPGKTEDERLELASPLRSVVPGAILLQAPLPAASPLTCSLLDTLLVLDEIEVDLSQPWAWSPLPIERNSRGSLIDWLALPPFGPRQILLPGMRTIAERGFRSPRRKKGASNPSRPGDDLFFASCGLMSAGGQTLLLSRWRVGGKSTLDLMQEFSQELPHTSATSAWQRSVQLSMESPIDPLLELRVKKEDLDQPLTASHPFFWAGYLVVDSGGIAPLAEDRSQDSEESKASISKDLGAKKTVPPAKSQKSVDDNKPVEN